jgi:hypothetical protein
MLGGVLEVCYGACLWLECWQLMSGVCGLDDDTVEI